MSFDSLNVPAVVNAVAPGAVMPAGPGGAGAYEQAVMRGFIGNMDAWLASLEGKPGTTLLAGLTDASDALKALNVPTPALQREVLGAAAVEDVAVKLDRDGDAGEATAALPLRGNVARPLISRFSDFSVSLTEAGVRSGDNVDDALKRALGWAVADGGRLWVPRGYWLRSNVPVDVSVDDSFGGISGVPGKSVFVLIDANVPVMHFAIQPGVNLRGTQFKGLEAQAQFTAPPTAYENSCLLAIDGASAGLGDGVFTDLSGFAVHHIVRIDTDPAVMSNDGLESHSGWLSFNRFRGSAGAYGIRPEYYVYFPRGSSTGSRFVDFGQGARRAWLRFEGAGYVTGDIVVIGGQCGFGRVLSFGAGLKYGRNIVIMGTQVDAGSTEVFECDDGALPPSRLKFLGSFGGTAPWASLPPVKHSFISGLGDSRWGEGGMIANYPSVPTDDGRATHTAELWKVTLARSTMTRLVVSVWGLVGGTDGGGTRQVFDVAVSYDGTVQIVDGTPLQMAPHLSSFGPFWPSIGHASASDGADVVVTFSTTWIDGSPSALETNITQEHGAAKLTRGAHVPL